MKKIAKLLSLLVATLPILANAKNHVQSVSNDAGKPRHYTKITRAEYLAKKEAERRIAQGQTLYDFGDGKPVWSLNTKNALRKKGIVLV